MSSSFGEFADKLDMLANGIERELSRGIEEAAVYLNGEIKQRVFSRGEDISGSNIGTYSASYKKRRSKNNRQSSFVDLQFSGTLFKSIGIAQKQDETTVVINKKKYKKGATTIEVARINEKKFKGKREVFAPSDDESDEAIKIIVDKYRKYVKRVLE